MKPFEYGMVVVSAYDDGAILGPEVINLKPEELFDTF